MIVPRTEMSDTVDRVTRLVNDYWRDAPFRAPETRPEFEARLLNTIWDVLQEGSNAQPVEAKA